MNVDRALNLVALVLSPFLVTGLINRVKALWAGRKGAPILQSAHDLLRLLRKTSVYSATTTPIFRIAPWVFLVTSLIAAAVMPLLGTSSLASFPYDFVWFAYLWGLGRVVVMLAALDTGSPFEGMGAAREATFSTLLEPAFFLTAGALCATSGTRSLSEALVAHHVTNTATFVAWAGCVATLLVVLQVETGRMPVDDPTTHLELTMIHEVMVLDHSGPDLGAIQFGSALKLYVGIAMVATLLNPWAGKSVLIAAPMNLAICGLVAIFLGTIESLVARLRLRAIPRYVLAALASAAVALLATAWRSGGGE